MKKGVVFFIPLLICFFSLHAQQMSSHGVRYLVTFDQVAKRYTTWVVPDYDTPNAFNPTDQEKGATAQVTLELPQSATLAEVEDVVGLWEKRPYRFEQNEILKNAGLDLKDKVYYVIGKSPRETVYGTFQKGIPVALFHFKLDNDQDVPVRVLGPDDDFVKVADTKLSLNIASSFYSRSGQLSNANSIPLEQFQGQIKEKELFSKASDSFSEEASTQIKAFPNPFQSEVKVQFFFPMQPTQGFLTLHDMRGRKVLSQERQLKQGLNESVLQLRHLPDGTYVVKIGALEWSLERTLIKNK